MSAQQWPGAAAGADRAAVAALYRYPVKGLSPEPLEAVTLTAGHGFPMDREFALARAGTVFDEARPEPLSKTHFLMLQRDAELAGIRSRYDDTTGSLHLSGPDDGWTARADLATAAGRAEVEAYVARALDLERDERPRLVRAPGHRFTDVSVVSAEMMRAVSIINLATVRDLGQRIGRPLDPLRFRANIYVEGLPAWAELDWIDPDRGIERELGLGDVRVRAARRIARCAATSVDPTTAVRDVNVPKALQTHLGHVFCGVYVHVRAGGELRPGDRLTF